jgi:DNA-directed RNA polymerase specialized sigma24 family protein
MSNQDELLTLHGQLLAGDVRAGSKIVERTLAPLAAIVARDIAGLPDGQDVEQACFDALFDYMAAPDRYDPQRAGLLTYLVAVAKGKAMTVRRGNERRARRDSEYALRERADRESVEEAADEEEEALRRIDWDRFGGELVKDPGDAEIIALIKVGAHTEAAVAEAVGLATDSEGLAAAGKRVERIRGRARRIAERKRI